MGSSPAIGSGMRPGLCGSPARAALVSETGMPDAAGTPVNKVSASLRNVVSGSREGRGSERVVRGGQGVAVKGHLSLFFNDYPAIQSSRSQPAV